jgi:hypothetical protein
LDEKIRRCGDRLMVAHIHIPKTGGSSLSTYFTECAKQVGRRFAYGHMHNFFNMSTARQKEVIAIDAHMGFGIHIHASFPLERRDCVVYLTIIRPYVDIILSAMGHQNAPISTISTSTSFKELMHPWAFNGALTYQLCCWSDAQHPSDAIYSDGTLIKQSNGGGKIEFKDCPQHFINASMCAARRLCNDIDLIGSLSTLKTLEATLNRILRCNANIPHINSHHIHMDEKWFRGLEHTLESEGSAFDTTLLKVGQLLIDGDRSMCESGAIKG